MDTQDKLPGTVLPGLSPAGNLTTTHLDRGLEEFEVDTVSTLDNSHTPGYKRSGRSITTTTGRSINSLSPRPSGHNIASIDSRVTNIENKINTLEVFLTQTIKSSMEELMQNLQSAGDLPSSIKT